MSAEKIPLEQTLAEIKAKEARSRRFAQLATIGPIVAAMLLLGYSAMRLIQAEAEARRFELEANDAKTKAADYHRQVGTLKAQLASTQNDLQNVNKELANTKNELERVKEELDAALKLDRYSHPVDMMDVKHTYARFPEAAHLLEQIFELKRENVRWQLNGRSPAVGFDSPNFAAYILRRAGWRGDVGGSDLASTSEALRSSLHQVTEAKPGDLLFYPTGYVMFYFEDHTGSPYVIGMTPFGISALRPDFAQPLGIYRASIRD